MDDQRQLSILYTLVYILYNENKLLFFLAVRNHIVRPCQQSDSWGNEDSHSLYTSSSGSWSLVQFRGPVMAAAGLLVGAIGGIGDDVLCLACFDGQDSTFFTGTTKRQIQPNTVQDNTLEIKCCLATINRNSVSKLHLRLEMIHVSRKRQSRNLRPSSQLGFQQGLNTTFTVRHQINLGAM